MTCSILVESDKEQTGLKLYIPRKEASLLWRRVLGTLTVEWLAVGVSQEFCKHYEE
jgi:hypothetical protein